MEYSLFKENKAYCYCAYKNNSDIKEIDLSLYSDVQSVIELCKEILEPLIKNNADIMIFGNLYDNDFFASNHGNSVDLLFRDTEFEPYINNWEDIVNNFTEIFENEIYDFDFDGYDYGELTYYFSPNCIYGDDEEELTEDGWESISSNFMEKLDETVLDFPIAIISKDIEDFDEYEYNDHLRIRFEIEPYCKNTIYF